LSNFGADTRSTNPLKNLTQSRLRPFSSFSYVGQGRKGAKEREKPEIATKKHKTHKKEDLKFGKRTFTAAVWID
jgi:hypothetical protein